MSSYRLLSYRNTQDKTCAGMLIGERVYNLALLKQHFNVEEFPAESLLDVFQNWSKAKVQLKKWASILGAENSIDSLPLSEVRLETPVQSPGALYCAGANYIDHIEEMTGKAPVKEEMKPYFFVVPPRAVLAGTKDFVRIPEYSSQLDWEAEIALVVGAEARNIDVEHAMDCIAGFTILNDLSCRDQMKRFDVPFLFDWIGQKCFTGSKPTGPWITPKEDVSDHNDLDIKLWVNGELQQDSNSRQMIFSCAELISYLSDHFTLYPGDMIATGTPAGVGHGRGVYLKTGDVVKIAVDGLGELITSLE